MSATLSLRARRGALAVTANNRLPYQLTQLPFRLGLRPLHDPAREAAELREYLGDRYEASRLNEAAELLDEELAEVGDEALLYRTSEAYLYDLTAFAMTPTKDPYLTELEAFLRAPARLLDYGCGIGSDGLYLIEKGFGVAFADFDNPSTRYLRWRLERRGREAEVYDVDKRDIPGGYDLAFSFDVLEHVEDPFAFLAELETHARYVLVNMLEAQDGETPLHHQPPVADLLRYAAGNGIKRYTRHYGFSHLVLYEPGSASRPLARRMALRAASRIGR